MMIRATFAAIPLVSLMVALALPAQAQTQSSGPRVQNSQQRYIYYRDEDRAYFERTKNRLTVRPRSFLTAGTETKQRDQHYTDYAYPPGGSWDYQNRNSMQGSFTRQPLPDPFDMPGWPKF